MQNSSGRFRKINEKGIWQRSRGKENGTKVKSVTKVLHPTTKPLDLNSKAGAALVSKKRIRSRAVIKTSTSTTGTSYKDAWKLTKIANIIKHTLEDRMKS